MTASYAHGTSTVPLLGENRERPAPVVAVVGAAAFEDLDARTRQRDRELLHDAMDRPRSERAELAGNLLASLESEPETDVEAAWASEIEPRA